MSGSNPNNDMCALISTLDVLRDPHDVGWFDVVTKGFR